MRDELGNEILVWQYPSGNLMLELRLVSEKKTRLIGNVNVSERILYLKRTRKKHLHLKSMSYGFNDYVIRAGTSFDKVHLTDEHGTYLLPVQVIKENGKHLYHKRSGFELQCFVPLSLIEQYRV